ncbi:MAG: glycosyltransferase family 4 protein [Isosphaeraceae bacterium]
MIFAVCFTNFGPYHLARLRALASRLTGRGDRLIAYEVAGSERTYPWARSERDEPFTATTLFPERVLETLEPFVCRKAMTAALDRDRPDALGIVGYARPESMAAAHWAWRHGRPAILMSESQAVDRPRAWWKEMIKRRRVGWFDSALVGGPRHRHYLIQLGMPADKIALGYNAVDNDYFESEARRARESRTARSGLPRSPYFLTVCRLVPEKNLNRLIEAFAHYREQSDARTAWDLVICGDGLGLANVNDAVSRSGCAHAVHLPGFLQVHELPRWYAHAGAFVLPSLSEPWGLVANEAAACGLPLLISSRAGCVDTLVPEPEGLTGGRFDPYDLEEMTTKLSWMATCPDEERLAIGRRAAETVASWNPDRFARGFLEALELARQPQRQRQRTAVGR